MRESRQLTQHLLACFLTFNPQMLFTNTSYPNVRKLCHDTVHSQ